MSPKAGYGVYTTVHIVCRQLQDLVLLKQQAVDECVALQQKNEICNQKIFELEERNLTIENELSQSTKNRVIIKGIFIALCLFSQVYQIQINWIITLNNMKLANLN